MTTIGWEVSPPIATFITSASDEEVVESVEGFCEYLKSGNGNQLDIDDKCEDFIYHCWTIYREKYLHAPEIPQGFITVRFWVQEASDPKSDRELGILHGEPILILCIALCSDLDTRTAFPLVDRCQKPAILGASSVGVEFLRLAFNDVFSFFDPVSDTSRFMGMTIKMVEWEPQNRVTGTLHDLDLCVEAARVTIFATEKSSREDFIINVGHFINLLQHRYDIRQSQDDRYHAEWLRTLLLETSATDLRQQAKSPSELALAYHGEYKKTGNLKELEVGINTLETLLGLSAPIRIEYTALIRYILLLLYQSRFNEHYEIKDLDKVIALSLRLGDLSVTKFKNLGEAADEMLGRMARSLGTFLLYRSNLFNALDDIGDAIRVLNYAIEKLPERESLENHHQWSRLTLVMALQCQFERTGDINYLDYSFETLDKTEERLAKKEFLPFSSESRGDIHEIEKLRTVKVMHFRLLGRSYRLKFRSTGNIKELHTAIEYMKLAKSAIYSHDSDDGLMREMSRLFLELFLLENDPYNLEQSIVEQHEALRRERKDTDSYGDVLFSQAVNYYIKWQVVSHDARDYFRSLYYFARAWEHQDANPLARLSVAQRLARCMADFGRLGEAYIYIKRALNCLGELNLLILQNADRYQQLKSGSAAGPDAAAIALQLGGSAYRSLELLETGRGIVTGLMLGMRTDITKLEQEYPKLAKRFISVRECLDTPIERANADDHIFSRKGVDENKRRRRQMGESYTEILEEIRSKPGFRTFLMQPTQSEMMAAAGRGTIVVVNISSYRCDAFLITKDSITSVYLPKVSLALVEFFASEIKTADESTVWKILSWLWDTTVSPILETLGITGAPSLSDGEIPHIWWVPTGPLSNLPLHAAGRHFKVSGESALDRVVSSYGLSVKSLVWNYQISDSYTGNADNALIVSMAKTQGFCALPCAQTEIDMLEKLCSSMGLNPIRPTSPVDRDTVIKNLRNCKIFHFAGHGRTHQTDPSESQLLLDDWKTNPLTVKALWEEKLQANAPFLAYLSACSTGLNDVYTSSDGLLDEGVNLVNACYLAGFRHVVGTLWEVQDSSSVEIAKIFYETLRDGGITDHAVSLGLHRAMRSLRDESVAIIAMGGGGFDPTVNQEPEEFVSSILSSKFEKYEREHRCGTEYLESLIRSDRNGKVIKLPKHGSLRWIPYVHFGL
ncbi:hypothetical protein TWF694_005773 [Orbilia ellipsospora]|uniref:CHAT domain-containing protein n=1 Tax=Orbilia ellipsospora TaxID=2528407 RepID=A0AAV9WS36_9PEZI